ncbi:MAG: dTDP-4-dehydrorhamnose 3,5-epimerase [Halocynthiibacter sp.]
MQIEESTLPGVLVLTPKVFEDSRGWFSETWSRPTLAAAGIGCDFVQDNWSFTHKAGTVRGLHYQAPPYAQDKLVRVGAGRALDIVVDVRKGSACYGKWAGFELSAQNRVQVLVPKGFLHGFVTLQDNTEFFYKCSAPYHAASDGAVHFADPDLAIDWGWDAGDVIISEKDAAAVAFADFDSPFEFKPLNAMTGT